MFPQLTLQLFDQNVTELNEALENYFKFMFVRDPLTRLLSVYFNKAMNTNLTSIKNFGPDVKRRGGEMIRKQNRTVSDADLPENRTLPTFEEFLEFILVSSLDGEWLFFKFVQAGWGANLGSYVFFIYFISLKQRL